MGYCQKLGNPHPITADVRYQMLDDSKRTGFPGQAGE